MPEDAMPKKILILTPFYPPNIGGAETFCEDLVFAIEKEHNVDVLTFMPFEGTAPNKHWYVGSKNAVTIYRIPWGIKHKTAWEGISFKNFFSVFPKMFFRTKSLIKANRYDIVHAQGLLAGLVAVLVHKRIFLTLLALYDFPSQKWYVQKLTKFILDRCEIIFVEGYNGMNDVNKLSSKYAYKIRRFNHWTDQSVFCPPKKREPGRRVLFVGRPIKIKGKHIIKRAQKILNSSNIEFKYVTKVKFQDLPKYYQWANIVCVPSLYDEGYSRVVMEASSCGCAVITSDRGSLPEQVKDFGHAVRAEPSAFAWAITDINYKVDGEYAYEFAKKHFSVKNAEVFLREYQNATL